MKFLSCSKMAVVSSVLVLCSARANFEEKERAYVQDLTVRIVKMVGFFQDNIAKFIDPSDHTPYKALVKELSKRLDDFQDQVMTPLAKKVAEARSKKTEIFNQSLSIVNDVLNDFMSKLTLLRSILEKSEYVNARDGLQAIKLAKEIEKYCKDLLDGKILGQLETKIDRLYDLVGRANEAAVLEKLKELKSVLSSLKGVSITKKAGAELKIVNGITAKIRHNK